MYLYVKYAEKVKDGETFKHEMVLEGFGPETIIGALRDTILKDGDEEFESIMITKSPPAMVSDAAARSGD